MSGAGIGMRKSTTLTFPLLGWYKIQKALIMVRSALSAAGPGTTSRGAAGWRSAAGSAPTTATATSASA